jgi:hypothetical protein
MTRLLLYAATILALTASATNAKDFLAGTRTTLAAPAKYDIPYTGKLTIWYTPSKEVLSEWKAKLEPNWSGVAFARHRKDDFTECHIHMLDAKALKAAGYNYNLVLRHELAHCNGWVGHDGGTKVPTGTVQLPAKLPESTRYLPIAPPVVCITPDRMIEPCADRKPTS